MRKGLEAALWAQSRVGAREGSREHQQILDIYNGIRPLPRGYAMGMKDPWCAAFVSAAAMAVGAGERYPLECSCSRIVEQAEKMGIWVEDDGYLPKIGDWILYNWQSKPEGDDQGAPDHVGIVVGIEGEEILAVEGNFDNCVKLRRFPRNWEKIRGFVSPKAVDGRFHTLDSLPPYARPTVEKLLSDGSLRGIGENDLSLTEDLIRTLVILDRRGIL